MSFIFDNDNIFDNGFCCTCLSYLQVL